MPRIAALSPSVPQLVKITSTGSAAPISAATCARALSIVRRRRCRSGECSTDCHNARCRMAASPRRLPAEPESSHCYRGKLPWPCMLHTKSFRLAHAALETDAEKLLRLDGKFHRQFFEHLFAEAIDNHIHRIFRRNAPLPAIEKLILADFRGRCLMLDLRALLRTSRYGKVCAPH